MAKFIKISRSDIDGGYIEKQENIVGAVEGELDGFEYLKAGTQIILTVVEMTQEEYDALPEFVGW